MKKGKVVIAPFSFALVTQFVITVHQYTLLRHVKLRDGFPRKKTAVLLDFVQMRGGGLPKFFGTFS